MSKKGLSMRGFFYGSLVMDDQNLYEKLTNQPHSAIY